MIIFTCAHCRETLQLPEASAGQKAQCPKCGNLVDVPLAPPPETPPPIFSVAPEQQHPERAQRSAPETPPPFPSAVPADAAEPYTSPPPPPRAAPREGSRTGLLLKPPLEFALNSIILGGVAFLTSPGIILVRIAGVFPSILLGLAVLGLGGLGLTVGIFGMLRAVSQKMQDFWYVLGGMVLSGLAIIVGLTMFIAAMIR
jgi:hypothetical protein